MRGSGEGNINQYLSDTIASVFGTVYTADVKGFTNRELFASDNADMLENLKNNAGNLTNADLQNMMHAVADASTQYQGGDYIMEVHCIFQKHFINTYNRQVYTA